ncbi:MAG: 1-(5-phosphoribosyl)-5-[(5-phosphoribosylamino)methylideneamino]imidazole-4-carboxamide isomerase [Epulopiscium sp.]|nr:1-(5-phosphoribosyl)-5-[(5-phosphoribosylamino)methylideneamino]imidazole-4-carboxamide isomerase [Candidatus Epulonipiscium sp.]
MILYPAIDIRDGKCVRLKRGDFDTTTVYGDDPVEMARRWEREGAHYIHVVDLDGAQHGAGANRDIISKMAKAVSIPIQLGGGIRSLEDIKEGLSLGVARVILGTAAIENPALVKEAVELYGSDKIVVGVDAKDGKVAIHGWETVSTKDAKDVCLEMKSYGVKTIVYTDIAQDGMMSGPNIKETEKIIKETGMDIIASGGVSKLEDLVNTKNIKAAGTIIGVALYLDAFTLGEALDIVK